jgi:hypothetical protein
MKLYVFAVVFTVTAFPTIVSAQGPTIEIGPGGIEVEPYRHEHEWRDRPEWRKCHELRERCIHKQELGEEGRGNCERYREHCRD